MQRCAVKMVNLNPLLKQYCRFLGLKVFNSDNFFMSSCNRNEQINFVEKPFKIVSTDI